MQVVHGSSPKWSTFCPHPVCEGDLSSGVEGFSLTCVCHKLKKPWKGLLTTARKMPGEGRSMSQQWELKLTEHYFILDQLHFGSRFKKDISSFNILE